MSFASEVKEEIVRIDLDIDNTRARLSAIIQLLASINLSNQGLAITFKTSQSSLIKRVSQDVQEIYGVKGEILMSKQTNLDKRNMYCLQINEKAKEILYDLDLWTDRGLLEHPRLMFLNNDEMIKSFLCGCFLATGSINSPRTTNYHLEIKVNNESFGNFLIKILEKFYITAKMTIRRGNYVVYIKTAEKISDFLILIKANDAMMQFEDIRIQRDFMNNLYRLDNVKIANEIKTQKVADEQIEAVEYLRKRDLLGNLSPKDQEIALLRLENPDASLLELSDMYFEKTGVSLSKSGIRHRFEKVFALRDKYMERD